MKIAYFTDTFLPQLNGIATALANQAEELGEKGHDVLIFTPKLDTIPRQKFKAKNVTVVHLPTVSALVYPEFKLGVLGLPKVLRYLSKFDPDIIHLHSPLTVGMDAVMAAKILKKPLVGTVHVYLTDSSYLRWLKYKLAVKIVDKVVDRYLNFLFSQCDLVLAPSKMLISELNEEGFKKRLMYLPNGVILNQTKTLTEKEKANLKKKYGLKEKVVLHFGRLSHEKNIDVLIKSFRIVAKKHPNASLLIIGDGPSRKKLTKLVKKLNLEKQVIFTGFIEHQILLSSGVLSVCDVFATASTMENNPMVVLEAMMFGLPIVGVKQAGLIELISSNGFLVKPGDIKELADSLEKLLVNDELAKKAGNKSLELIKPYSVNTVVNQLVNVYQTLQS